MTNKYSLPRGTADILPIESPLWQEIESKARQICHLYNFKEIRTPIFEETALFKRSLGQTSDVVNKQLLELASQRITADDPIELAGLALRPEGTASVVRSYIENNIDRQEMISKFYYIGPMFRGERPQKGRLRQFHQIGAETIGPGATQPYLDVETIALAINLLKSFGLKDFKLKINTLGNLEDKENFSKILREKLKSYLIDLSEYSKSRYERNVFRILDSKEESDKEIIKKIKLDYSFLSSESQRKYDIVKSALKDIGIKFEEDICLVRGLDYYNYTVFEITDDSLGSQNALGAGGRYNNLVGSLGGESRIDIGGVGFSLGIERILLALQANSENYRPKLDVYLAPLDDKSYKEAFQVLNSLRKKGISCEMNYLQQSLKNQMRAADKSGALGAIIFGEEELKTRQVVLKIMRNEEIKSEPEIIQVLADLNFQCRKDK
ncbi:MAG TPA: histidine--tRNA ligase [Candidatus Omnitrophota bacterium]|nr:histidine--tRNA ligase [Candidatus Omnitrophota bacterium]HPN88534.1 histidine--tRNA ligase [Candidatus Omnitrophota bacterium]